MEIVEVDLNDATALQIMRAIYKSLKGIEMNESELVTKVDAITAEIANDNALISSVIGTLNTTISNLNSQVAALQAAAADPVVTTALATSADNLQAAADSLNAVVSPGPAPAP